MSISSGGHRRSLYGCVVLVLLLVALALPCPALAATFSVEQVDIDATVATDGSLTVAEQRTYHFSEYINGFFWDVPRGTYEGRSLDTVVQRIEVLEGGRAVDIIPASSEEEDAVPEAGTYEVIEEPDCLHIKVYWPTEGGAHAFRVTYTIPNLVSRWSDTAELYWQYMPANEGTGAEWTNITATVHLPVPLGEPVIPGENVRAWAHGPLDGHLEIVGSDVVLFSPGVGSAEFLEARVAFPPSWISEAAPTPTARLQTILDEEKQWADEANARRRSARMANVCTTGVMGLAALGTFIATALHKRRNRDEWPKAKFDEPYYRDIPSDDHPAVLGMLCSGQSLSGKDMTATLMHLTNQGRITLERVVRETEGGFGKVTREYDYRLVRGSDKPNARYVSNRAGSSKIDDAAMAFLYDTVAGIGVHDELAQSATGAPAVLVSSFAKAQKKSPDRYANAYSGWSKAVKSAYQKRGFAGKKHETEGIYPGILGLADVGLIVILGLGGAILEVMQIPLVLSICACFGSALYAIWNTDERSYVTYSQDAAELKAKLGALKRWLCEFTRLEEAIPTDVVLWNRLLVLATVLGVSQEVIAQLRVAAPKLLEDVGASEWYGDDDYSPFEQMNDVLEKVPRGPGSSSSSSSGYHSVSNSSLSRSRNSSSRGSGGGFYSGGGGGFSGGGRGGTF